METPKLNLIVTQQAIFIRNHTLSGVLQFMAQRKKLKILLQLEWKI
jgi:hypothetical protein